jgi:hypothetical protein
MRVRRWAKCADSRRNSATGFTLPTPTSPGLASIGASGNQRIEGLEALNADLVAALESIRNQVTVYPDGNAFSRNQTVKTIDNIAEAALAKAKGGE